MTTPSDVPPVERTAVPMPTIELDRRDFIWSLALTMPLLLLALTPAAHAPWWIIATLLGFPAFMGGLLWVKRRRQRSQAAGETSLVLTPEAIELNWGLRRPTRITFDEITRVVASSVMDGFGDPSMSLRIETPERRMTVRGDLLVQSSLIERLHQLPGFDPDAFARSWADEAVWQDSWRPKRTVVFLKALAVQA